MELVTNEMLTRYLEDDWVQRFVMSDHNSQHANLTCTRWLLDSAPKRCIFSQLYHDLEKQFSGRVLDVGGGLTAFTTRFGNSFDYELLDLMNHDDRASVDLVAAALPVGAIHRMDWKEFVPNGTYDVVIANDLFPNADQRLGEFLEKFLPITRELRISLTYYNNRICYKVKRVDADEFLFVRPWDGYRLGKELLPFEEQMIEPKFSLLERDAPSLFPNGRQVCLATIRGGGERG